MPEKIVLEQDKNIKTKDFNWNTDFIFSNAKNEVTDLKQNANVMELISGNGFAKQGYPVRGLFSIPFVGLDKDGIPVIINEKGEATSTDKFPGTPKYWFPEV